LPDIKGDENVKRKAALVGTLFFSFFWLIGSGLFSMYLDHLNTYNRVFGAIGAFVIMMVWLYYTSIIILLGGEFNYRTYLTLTKKQEMKFKQIDNEDLYEE
jgi:membrane protein